MKHVGTVAGRELGALFVSPVAYVVLTLYALIAGFFFIAGVVGFLETVRQAQALQAFDFLARVNLNDMVIRDFVGTMLVMMLFLMPALTMGLFAAEKANGTDELLLTSPLTIGDIVLGKYLAVAVFVGILTLATAIFPGILFLYGDPELGKTAGALLGFALSGLTFAAIGAFASSVTRSQLIAFILAMVLLLILWIIGFVAEVGALGSQTWLEDVLGYLGLGARPVRMAEGQVKSGDLAYFAMWIAVALLLTRAAVESTRWR